MPRKTTNDDTPTPPQFLRVTLRPEDYAALLEMARDNYRTPELQAGYLIMRVLIDAKANNQAAQLQARLQARKAADTD